MDIFFSSDIVRDVGDFLRGNYPSSLIATAGLDEAMERHFNELGIRTAAWVKGGVLVDARAILARGGEGLIKEVKSNADGVPVILIPDYAHGDVFNDYTVSGIRYCKCERPNSIFYNTCDNYERLSASAYAGALGLYAELLDTAASAIRTPEVIEARELIGECRDNLFRELTAEELILKTAEIKGKRSSSAATFTELVGSLLAAGPEDDPVRTFFLSAYIAVLLGIRFTKFDFCSILLGKDHVRARILEERLGLPRVGAYKACRDLRLFKPAVMRYALSETELEEVLLRFRFEGGIGGIDILKLLDSFAIAADYSPSSGIFEELARSGFIDAIIDVTA